ncbi:MAG: NAD(P)-dependent oxidoreductase [Betaproteobacteria bacterium]|jgi:3-hydroxyisobutyrate dehydrogenase-like beta-hydroxyacid dehydrogenase
MQKNKIGFIGLGIMGGAISKNLLDAGFDVLGFDISASATDRHQANGGTIATSIQDVCEQVNVIFTSLPTEKALADVIQGLNGVCSVKGSQIIIEISTMPLSLKIELETALSKAGKKMLDCPVSGTGAQAILKDLIVFASGEQSSYDVVKDIFPGMSKSQFFLGDFGNGSKMKFLANVLVGIHNAAAAEVFALAGKAGINLSDVYEVLKDSAGASKMFQMRGPLMVNNDYDKVTATVDTFMKDLSIISKFAADLKCPTPLFDVTHQLYYATLNQGLGQKDSASVCALMEKLAGVKRD